MGNRFDIERALNQESEDQGCLRIDINRSIGFRSRSRHSLETQPENIYNNNSRQVRMGLGNHFDNRSPLSSTGSMRATQKQQRFKHIRMMRD